MHDQRRVIYKEIKNIPYREAWDYQTVLHQELVKRKLRNRDLEDPEKTHHYLLLCEHNPVYTLGKSGSKDHLLLSEKQLSSGKFEFFKINRGGDITYHGPGQITGYPILDLDAFFTDVHKYVRYLEEIIIKTIAHYGIIGQRIEGYTGVWIAPDKAKDPFRKICAIGVHLSRWVTMHGFALNVNTDLSHFDNIVPCGIQDEDKIVTSMQAELGRKVDLDEVCLTLKEYFAQQFDFTYLPE